MPALGNVNEKEFGAPGALVMMPELATVVGLVIALGPCGCGATCTSKRPGLPHKKGLSPATGMSAVASQTGISGSTESEPAPCGNVIVCGSLMVLVTHLTVSPGLTLIVPGNISVISTCCVAVPATAVMVCVPSAFNATLALLSRRTWDKASAVSRLN